MDPLPRQVSGTKSPKYSRESTLKMNWSSENGVIYTSRHPADNGLVVPSTTTTIVFKSILSFPNQINLYIFWIMILRKIQLNVGIEISNNKNVKITTQ